MGRLERKFFDFYEAISGDIYKFCTAINFEPTFQQRWVLDAVQRATMGLDKRRIACKSGQGPGKTTVSVVAGLWRVIRSPDALTIVTAPTMRQCRDVWLMEARRRLATAEPMLKKFINITKTKIEVAGRPDWGVKLVTATREENAQGYHQENMTVIAEEASGIPREIITQFKGTLSNPDDLFLMIGNPNTRDCDFFNCFNSERDKWQTATFNTEETAAKRPDIVNPQRNLDLEDEYGRDSDVYRIRVLGEFPHSDPNCVISSEEVERCTGLTQKRMLEAAQVLRTDGVSAKQFGIDFARFGGDESTIYRRTGNAITEWKRYTHTEPANVVDEAFRMQHSAGWRNRKTWYVADAGGMGQGIMYRFYEADRQVFEFHNGGKAHDEQFDNKITEAWFTMAKKIRNEPMSLPKDNRLIQQLCTRQYFTTRKGKLILESKDEYMKRGHDSPDRADGIVMSYYDDMIADSQVASRPTRNRGSVLR